MHTDHSEKFSPDGIELLYHSRCFSFASSFFLFSFQPFCLVHRKISLRRSFPRFTSEPSCNKEIRRMVVLISYPSTVVHICFSFKYRVQRSQENVTSDVVKKQFQNSRLSTNFASKPSFHLILK